MPRCKLLEYHGSNLATFECNAGHRFKLALMKRDPLGKLPSEAMLQKMASWWSKSGVNIPCPKCREP